LAWYDIVVVVVVCAKGNDKGFAVVMAEEVSVQPLMSFWEGVSWVEGVPTVQVVQGQRLLAYSLPEFF